MNTFFAQHLAAVRNALRRLLAAPLNTLLSLLEQQTVEVVCC